MYCKDYSNPKKDDVVWSNDKTLLPKDRQFDASPDLLCTVGDRDCDEWAQGYIFDPEIGWNLACYEHCMKVLGEGVRPEVAQHKKQLDDDRAVEVALDRAAVLSPATRRIVKTGALCDNPHPEATDAPPAIVGVFATKKGASQKDRFLCGTCAILFIHENVVGKLGDFEPFEMISVAKK